MGCPVGQDHVALALASLAIGLGAVVADEHLGVGLRQAAGIPAASEPAQQPPHAAAIFSFPLRDCLLKAAWRTRITHFANQGPLSSRYRRCKNAA